MEEEEKEEAVTVEWQEGLVFPSRTCGLLGRPLSSPFLTPLLFLLGGNFDLKV